MRGVLPRTFLPLDFLQHFYYTVKYSGVNLIGYIARALALLERFALQRVPLFFLFLCVNGESRIDEGVGSGRW